MGNRRSRKDRGRKREKRWLDRGSEGEKDDEVKIERERNRMMKRRTGTLYSQRQQEKERKRERGREREREIFCSTLFTNSQNDQMEARIIIASRKFVPSYGIFLSKTNF